MSRAWLAAIAFCSGACGGSSSSAPHLAIQGIEPACPVPGGNLIFTLVGSDAPSCDSGRIFAGDRELSNLGIAGTSPPTLVARLPVGFVPPPGAEIRMVCGDATASTRWSPGCGPGDGGADAGADADEHKPDVSPFVCEQPIEAVIEAVDKEGRPFPRDAEGVFLLPITAHDFAFDTGNSRYVSGRDVTYTFSSDCFPRVTVRAPVLGGFSAEGYWLEKRCQFMVAILDLGCPQARTAGAQGALKVVP